MRGWIRSAGGRKFVLGILFLIPAVVFSALKMYRTMELYTDFSWKVFGLYVGFNVASSGAAALIKKFTGGNDDG